MWIATTRGFYSAVQHNDDRDFLMIRARSRVDLENLADLFVELDIVETLINADYPYRVTVDRAEWGHALQAMVEEVDYANFKTAVAATNPARSHGPYMAVWRAMHDIEREPGAIGPRLTLGNQLKLAKLPKQAKAKQAKPKQAKVAKAAAKAGA